MIILIIILFNYYKYKLIIIKGNDYGGINYGKLNLKIFSG